MAAFHHGGRVLQKDIGYRPIGNYTDTSVIGAVYTAPDADPDKFPLNVPQLFLGGRDETADLGTSGTGMDIFDGIYDQGVAPPVVAVRVKHSNDIDQQMLNIIGAYNARSGVHAFWSAKNTVYKVPKILITPGFMSQRVIGGVTLILVGSGGSGYTEFDAKGNRVTRIVIDGHGYGGGATAVPVIRKGVITGIRMTNSGFGHDGSKVTVQIVGDGENATVRDIVVGSAANPIVAELGGIANRLRATIIADCPNGTAEDSVAYRRDWESRRIYCVDNHGLVGVASVAQPNSARVAGLLAKVDNEEGFWVSPSNHVIEGLVGTSRAIDDSGVGGEADYLNENDVATVLHRGGGRKLWGNHAATSDPLWKMFAAGRCLDKIYDDIEFNIDTLYPGRPLNLQFFEGVCDSVNENLRLRKAQGSILGGRIWIDPKRNPPGELLQGRPVFSGDIEPTGVAEDIQIEMQRNPGYYKELIDQVVLAISN